MGTAPQPDEPEGPVLVPGREATNDPTDVRSPNQEDGSGNNMTVLIIVLAALAGLIAAMIAAFLCKRKVGKP